MTDIRTEYKRGLWIATDGKLTATSKQSKEKAAQLLEKKIKRWQIAKDLIKES